MQGEIDADMFDLGVFPVEFSVLFCHFPVIHGSLFVAPVF
jgi:hypothetical protein